MAIEVQPSAEVANWAATNESGQLRRLRRVAERVGLAVTKIPQRSRLFHEYGPYMITHPASKYAIVASGLHLEDVEKWLLGHPHKSEQRWGKATPSANNIRRIDPGVGAAPG